MAILTETILEKGENIMIYETPKVDEIGDAKDVIQGAGGHLRDADRSLTLGLDVTDLDD
jgi:hypothetical protein